MNHMIDAMQEHSILGEDKEARIVLEKYFRYTAHYIVAASEFMRPDQVSANAFSMHAGYFFSPRMRLMLNFLQIS